MQFASESESAPEFEDSDHVITKAHTKQQTAVGTATSQSNVIDFCSESDSWSDTERDSDASIESIDSISDWCTSGSSASDDEQSSCDSDSDCVPVTRLQPGRPRAPIGSAADTRRNARRRKRAAEKKLETQLEREWREAVALGNDVRAEELYLKLLPTVRGRKLFPSHTKLSTQVQGFNTVAQNVRSLHATLGVRSKHRGAIASRITMGLPPAFTKEVLGFKPAYLRKVKEREQEQLCLGQSKPPALLTEGRHDTKGREHFCSEFRRLVKEFFIANTAILSGAKTRTRRLMMNKGRFECEFEAGYPQLLRKLAELEPAVRPDPESKRILTVRHMDILAAEAAQQADDFCEATEYKQRLQIALQR